MEPATSIIKALGGPTKVAVIAGVHRTRVHGWTRPKGVGGTGGHIPLPHIPKLLSAAREKGIDLTADDFIPQSSEEASA